MNEQNHNNSCKVKALEEERRKLEEELEEERRKLEEERRKQEEELRKLEEELRKLELKNEHYQKKNEERKKLRIGTFFSPWDFVWGVDEITKNECNGAFNKMCRDDSQPYSALFLNPSNRSAQKNSNGRPRHPNVANSSSIGNGSPLASSLLGRKSQTSSPSSIHTTRSHRSQSVNCTDFSGRIDSTRAHLIPDPKKSDCHRYYSIICQAVVGSSLCNDLKSKNELKSIGQRVAESDYNLLRAPHYHGEYFDNKPCWIFVPAWPLEKILEWKTDDAYPVLAVACDFGGIGVEEAYQMMCNSGYNHMSPSDSNAHDYPSGDAGDLIRSKCKKKEYLNATENLRQMILAMAETLVGEGGRPDEVLGNTSDIMPEDMYKYIVKKLKKERVQGGFIGPEPNKDQYDAVQFAETRKSLREGIQLPKAKNADFHKFELLQFVVDPKRGLDVCPDPMLLLIKAAVNWSWQHGQKLLPAYWCLNEEEVFERESVASFTPIPTMIEFKPVPMTPNDDDDVSLYE